MGDQKHTSLAAGLAGLKAKRQRVVIPELRDENDEPQTIYVRQLTLAERDELRTRASAVGGGEASYNADIAIRCAALADGSDAFTKADKPLLTTQVPASIMARIAYAATHVIDLDDAEKN